MQCHDATLAKSPEAAATDIMGEGTLIEVVRLKVLGKTSVRMVDGVSDAAHSGGDCLQPIESSLDSSEAAPWDLHTSKVSVGFIITIQISSRWGARKPEDHPLTPNMYTCFNCLENGWEVVVAQVGVPGRQCRGLWAACQVGWGTCQLSRDSSSPVHVSPP